MTEKRFPILSCDGRKFPGLPKSVPWALVEPHAEQADRNHQQTLEELAERGGLSWCELLAVLQDRPWSKVDTEIAFHSVLAIAGGQL